jgi:hypothetical protein
MSYDASATFMLRACLALPITMYSPSGIIVRRHEGPGTTSHHAYPRQANTGAMTVRPIAMMFCQYPS